MDTSATTETPPRRVPVTDRVFSDEALAAVEEARSCVAEMDEARRLISRLATRRADAVRRAMAAGMTQADVARALGVWPTAISGLLKPS